MIAASAVFVVVTAVAVVIAQGRRRPVAADAGGDTAERMLVAVARLAPEARRQWILAAVAERRASYDRRGRRQLALGAARAALTRSATSSPVDVERLTGALAVMVLALAAFGLVHYPGLRDGVAWLVYLVLLVIGVVGYVLGALVVSRIGQPSRFAIEAALPALVLSALAATGTGPASLAIVVAIFVLPGITGFVLARRTRSWARGLVDATACGLLAGLFAFVGYVTVLYVTDGGTATAGLLAAFRASGARDYRTWIVGDDLGGACFMLAFIPVAAIAVGVVASTFGGRHSSAPARPN